MELMVVSKAGDENLVKFVETLSINSINDIKHIR